MYVWRMCARTIPLFHRLITATCRGLTSQWIAHSHLGVCTQRRRPCRQWSENNEKYVEEKNEHQIQTEVSAKNYIRAKSHTKKKLQEGKPNKQMPLQMRHIR